MKKAIVMSTGAMMCIISHYDWRKSCLGGCKYMCKAIHAHANTMAKLPHRPVFIFQNN